MKINVRQISFIMLAYTAASRMLIYPTLLATYSGRDLLFSALLSFILGTVIIWSVSFLSSKTDKTFYELVSSTVGEVAAKIIFGFLGLFFVLASIMPLFEQQLYVHAIFYDTVPSLITFLPFFAFAVYAGTKKLTNIGRCADICLPIFLVTIALIFAMGTSELEISNFLPILKTPARGIFKGSLYTMYYFVEPCYLLMFLGAFKYKKGDAFKITLSYVGAGLIIMLFLFIFYAVYGNIGVSRNFPISKIAVHFQGMQIIGRIDLVLLYALELVMLFAAVLNIQLATHCFSLCTGFKGLKSRAVISVVICIILAAIIVTCTTFFSNLHLIYQKWLWIVFAVFAVLLPLVSWLFKRRKEE